MDLALPDKDDKDEPHDMKVDEGRTLTVILVTMKFSGFIQECPFAVQNKIHTVAKELEKKY
jgi:hypothetical protein